MILDLQTSCKNCTVSLKYLFSNARSSTRLRTRFYKYLIWFPTSNMSSALILQFYSTFKTQSQSYNLWEASFPLVQNNFSWRIGHCDSSGLVQDSNCLEVSRCSPALFLPSSPTSHCVFSNVEVVTCLASSLCHYFPYTQFTSCIYGTYISVCSSGE